MRIAVVGGGPAGLFFALLAKRRDMGHDITVYEQNPPGATYGWGVVFSDVALSSMGDGRDVFDNLNARYARCDFIEVVHQGVHVQLRNNHFSRIARLDLLDALEAACRGAGVKIEHGTRIDDIHSLAGCADLVAAADGANSAVRTQLAEYFQPSIETRRNLFAWYGTRQLFHPVSLIFRATEHGTFIAHAYQYSDDLSTFLVETDPSTWGRSGLGAMDDDASRAFCADIFRAELGANDLLSNRSLWFKASVIRTERWRHDNVVLLGDALRTVHFSLGSGTRLALQDAIALDRALGDSTDLQAAFDRYEELRRSSSTSFQLSADRSLDWYETIDRRMHLDPIAFAHSFMTRTGRVTDADLENRDPHFFAQVAANRSH